MKNELQVYVHCLSALDIGHHRLDCPQTKRNNMSVTIPLTKTLPFSNPSIDEDGELCMDGIGDSIVSFVCSYCGQFLFHSDDLNWMQGGYWIKPGLTLTKKYYNGDTEIITCPRCKKERRLHFFSYKG